MNLIDAIHTMDGLFDEIAAIHELTKDEGLQGLADSIVYAAGSADSFERAQRVEDICVDLWSQGYAGISEATMLAVVNGLYHRLQS